MKFCSMSTCPAENTIMVLSWHTMVQSHMATIHIVYMYHGAVLFGNHTYCIHVPWWSPIWQPYISWYNGVVTKMPY